MPFGRLDRRDNVLAISEERIDERISRIVWRWKSYKGAVSH